MKSAGVDVQMIYYIFKTYIRTKYIKYLMGSVGDNVQLIYNGSSRAGDGGTTDKSIRKLTPPPKQRGPKKSSKEVETCLEKEFKQQLQFSRLIHLELIIIVLQVCLQFSACSQGNQNGNKRNTVLNENTTKRKNAYKAG